MPTVSVCIPTYNTARYLPFAIESVLRQEYKDFELVICDDASTDNTAEICRGYDDSRIRYLRTAGKSGQGGIFNRCLSEARGEYLTILHADDYFLPGFLHDRVSRLTRGSPLEFVFGAVQVVDAEGRTTTISGRWPEDRTFAVKELLEPMLFACVLTPPSLMIRTSCLAKVGSFRTDLTWGVDWEWNLRLAEHCSGCYASAPLAAYRVHDGSGTAEILNAAKNGPQEWLILRETFSRLAKVDSKLCKLQGAVYKALGMRHMYFASEALLADRKRVARNNLWYALVSDYALAIRPTFWALLAGSIGPKACYTVFQALRSGRRTPPSTKALS